MTASQEAPPRDAQTADGPGEERRISRRAFARGSAAAVAVSALAGPALAEASTTSRLRRARASALPDVPLHDLEIAEAAPLLEDGTLSPVELAEAFLERIRAVEPAIDAFVHEYPADEVLAQARQAARELRAGRSRGPLHGVTVGVKDIFFTAGKPTEGNSRLYAGFVPDEDATSVAALKAAGTVILGKTGTSELATATAWPAKNPWDPRRTPGGSSAGSAAGLGASEFTFAMGSCTGGSIRGPAANCGLSGFKPTYGTISAYGVFPLSWTMDHVGPLCHSALDCALVVDALGGQDPRDPTTRPVRAYALARALLDLPRRRPLRGVTVGIPAPDTFLLGVPNDEEIAAWESAVTTLRGLGARVRRVAPTVLLPGMTSVSSIYDITRNVEIGAYQFQRLMRDPAAMSPEYLSRVSSGALAPGHAYVQAQRVRRAWREAFLAVFDEVDVLVHPADTIARLLAPATDPPLPRRSTGSKTNIWNISGAPSIAIPTGLSRAEGMPLSMQVAADAGNDATALTVAHAFQTATTFHKLRPEL